MKWNPSESLSMQLPAAGAEEHAVTAVREAQDAAAAEPANAVQSDGGRVFKTGCRADILEVDPVRCRRDADRNHVVVRLAGLLVDERGQRESRRARANLVGREVRITWGKIFGDVDDRGLVLARMYGAKDRIRVGQALGRHCGR